MTETVTFKMADTTGFSNKVLTIKGLRKLTGAGLKEAKEFVEKVDESGVVVAKVQVTANAEDAEDAINMMAGGGIIVDRDYKENLDSIIDKLKDVASDAIKADQLELAKEILSLAIENRL